MSSSRIPSRETHAKVCATQQGSDLNECVVLSSHMGSRAAPPITARGG